MYKGKLRPAGTSRRVFDWRDHAHGRRRQPRPRADRKLDYPQIGLAWRARRARATAAIHSDRSQPHTIRANFGLIMVRGSHYGATARGSPELRTYAAWRNLKNRCDNRRNPKYRHYGGRGIRYDPKWASFAGFVDDMGLAPAGMSLDRIDNDGPYCRTNCRWATHKQQNRNARFNRIVEFDGERQPLAAWAEQLGINWVTLRSRLDMG